MPDEERRVDTRILRQTCVLPDEETGANIRTLEDKCNAERTVDTKMLKAKPVFA